MKGHMLRAILLMGLVFLGLAPSLQTPFFMDDYLHLTLLQENWGNLRSISYNTYSTKSVPPSTIRENLPWWTDTNFQFHYFRPVATLSLALDYMLWSNDPKGYHYTCLFLHCLCVFLLYVLALRMGLSKGFALFGALISGLHLNHLFSVSWVCNRDSTLGALFFIGSLIAYLGYLDSAHRRRRLLLLSLSFVLFIVGVLSKENTVVEPAVLLIIVAVRKGLLGHAQDRKGASILSELLPLIPFVLFSLSYSGWYALSGHGVSTGYLRVTPDNGLLENASIIGRNLFLYMIALYFYVPPEFNLTAFKWPWWLVWTLGLALPAGLLFWKRKVFQRLPILWVFVIWTIVFFVSPLFFIPLGRLLYVATMGYGLFMAGIFQEILHGVEKRVWKVCVWTLLLFYFVLIPFSLDSASAAFLSKKGDEIHMSLDRAISEVEKDLPLDGEIFLINVPDPPSVYMAGVVHRFYSSGKGRRVFALGNVPEVPLIEQAGNTSLRVRNDKGIIDLNVVAPLIALAEGTEVEMPSFTVKVERTEGKTPSQVLFSFPKPLESPEYAFITFVDHKAKRMRFP